MTTFELKSPTHEKKKQKEIDIKSLVKKPDISKLTIRMPAKLHHDLKMSALQKKVKLKDYVIEILKKEVDEKSL